MSDVWIVGGGLSGLTTAYYLVQAGFRPTLVEQQPRLGGLLRTATIQGALIEEGPDSYLAAKPWAAQLLQELGLADQIVGSNDSLRRTFILREGQLRPLPEGLQMVAPTKIWPVLTTSLLSLPSKVRIGLEYFRKPSPQPVDERSVATFVREHYGDEMLDYIVEPLLAGVYGGSPEQLSASAVLPRFVELERKYGSISRGALAEPTPKSGSTMFQSLRGGWSRLVEALESRLEGRMDRIIGRAESLTSDRLRVDGEWHKCNRLVLACPAFAAAEVLTSTSSHLAALLREIPYTSAMTVALGYDRASITHPLNGFGFLIPARERRHVAACTWVDSKFPHRVPAGQTMLRCFLGSGKDAAVLDESDDRVLAIISDELRHIMGVTAEPRYAHFSRWPRSMPQYTVGHEQRVAAIFSEVEKLPNVWLTGNAYRGIGVPDTIRMAKETAKLIAQSQEVPPSSG